MTALRAAAASVDITPPPGGMMDGYGSRLTPSQGVHDPLFARVLVLDYGESTSTAHPEAPEGRAAVIVGCDLLGVHPWLTAELRRRVRESLGIAEDAVLLAATHNHAGPVGLRAGMFSRLDEALAETTVAKIVAAVEQAWESRRPVTLKTGTAEVDTIGMNRRDPAGPADAVLRAVLFDGEDGPVASLLNFACHATVLSGANMLLSAEFPASPAASSKRRRARPPSTSTAPAETSTRCGCARTSPASSARGRPSAARPCGCSPTSARRATACARTTSAGTSSPSAPCPDASPSRASASPGGRSTCRCASSLPTRSTWFTRIEAAQAEADRHPPPPPRRGGEGPGPAARHGTTLAPLQASAGPPSGRGAPAKPARTAQNCRRSRSAMASRFLALPGEFFAETGALIRKDAGIEQLLIACYANDYAGYIVPEHAYDEGGYESGVTFFTGEAEAIIRAASLELLREVCRDGD